MTVILPRLHQPIGREMLDAGGKAVRGTFVRTVEPSHRRSGHPSAKGGRFAEAFHASAPARVAHHVRHRREGHVNAPSRGFFGAGAGHDLRVFLREGSAHTQRDRENAAHSVDHVAHDQRRDTVLRFPHQSPNFLLLLLVDAEGTDQAARLKHLLPAQMKLSHRPRRLSGIGKKALHADLAYLRDFLLQAHIADQRPQFFGRHADFPPIGCLCVHCIISSGWEQLEDRALPCTFLPLFHSARHAGKNIPAFPFSGKAGIFFTVPGVP